MNRIIDPPWVKLDARLIDYYDMNLSDGAFRAMVMLHVNLFRRGPVPAGTDRFISYLGFGGGANRGSAMEIDTLVPATADGRRFFPQIEEWRAGYLGLSSKQRTIALGRERRKRAAPPVIDGPPASAYDLPAFAGDSREWPGGTTTGATTGVTSRAPQVAQKEKKEEARAPSVPSAPAYAPAPAPVAALDASSGELLPGGSPSSASVKVTRNHQDRWCLKCGLHLHREVPDGVPWEPQCPQCPGQVWMLSVSASERAVNVERTDEKKHAAVSAVRGRAGIARDPGRAADPVVPQVPVPSRLGRQLDLKPQSTAATVAPRRAAAEAVRPQVKAKPGAKRPAASKLTVVKKPAKKKRRPL